MPASFMLSPTDEETGNDPCEPDVPNTGSHQIVSAENRIFGSSSDYLEADIVQADVLKTKREAEIQSALRFAGSISGLVIVLSDLIHLR